MFDLNPEQAVIGIALNDRRALDDLDLLGPEDFRDERYGELWGLIRSRHQSGKPHDVTSMVAVSRIRDLTAADIQAMAIGAPMGASASHYGALVAAQAQQDRLVAVGTRIIQEAQEAPLAEMTEVAEAARAAVDEASGLDLGQNGIRAGDYFDPFMAAVGTTAVKRIPSPWPELDDHTGGFRPGAVYVIGARPAAGKSVFGLQIANHLSRNDGGGKVLFSSLEMTRDEIMPRLIAQTCSVPLKAFEPGGMTDRYRDMIAQHADTLRASNVVFDDRASITPALIRSYARTLSRRGHLSGIVVDYLQLMQGAKGTRKSRQEIVSDYSRSLKMLAKEMNVPVIVLSQLNRNSAQPGAEPTIADLRESGAIEQDADVILLLHRDDNHLGEVFVGVGKNRHGTTGMVRLAFQGGYSRADSMGGAWSG